MVEVKGFCEDQFSEVKDVFRENFDKRHEVGASFAATLNGELVVDIWGGYKDAAQTQPWEKDTLVCVYSTTKVMAALCLHILIDRGLVELDKPVAKYWPEFAQNGKDGVLVRHILSHSSGITRFDEEITVQDLYNWDKMCNMLASQNPWWNPGTKPGYQMITFSFLVGNIVKLVSGKSIGTFFKEEVADPLDIDFHIGTPEKFDMRIGELVGKDVPKYQKWVVSHLAPKIGKVIFNPDPNELFKYSGSREWRASELASSSGHGNARSIAEVGAILACGGTYKDKKILSKERIEEAITPQIMGRDKTTTVKIKYGLGWQVDPIISSLGPRSFSWGGYGGSNCVMDLESQTSAAYAMNNLYSVFKPDLRAHKLIKAFRESL